MENKNIIAFSVSDKYNLKEMKYLQLSSNICNVKLNIIGLNREFNWIKRLEYYLEALYSIENNPIIIFTDAYDVFYSDNSEIIMRKFLEMNCDIVFSCEQWYSHQINNKEIKYFYDKNSTLYGNNSIYRYICVGCYMGYKNSLISLLTNVLDSKFREEVKMNNGDNTNDQCLLGYYLTKHLDNKTIKLDYNCDIFYTPTQDWFDVEKCIRIFNEKKPSIVHVPFKKRFLHLLNAMFLDKYKYVLNNM